MLSNDNKKTGITNESLARLIGSELLNKLSSELGGRRIYVSRNPGPHAPLVICIGLDAAIILGKAYGGETFDVPTSLARRAAIKAELDKGTKIAKIAADLKVSRRYVYMVWEQEMNKAKNKKQLDLFEA